MNHLGLLFALTFFAAASACKPEITNANIEAVNSRKEKADLAGRKSLTPKEVESILGLPDRVENTTIELETQKKQVPVTRYYYEQDGQVIELHFFDNKLINRVPQWAKPATDKHQP
ncbi:MAG: hypothetical protein WCO60_03140 [Verrucomicrobiota bacterium]